MLKCYKSKRLKFPKRAVEDVVLEIVFRQMVVRSPIIFVLKPPRVVEVVELFVEMLVEMVDKKKRLRRDEMIIAEKCKIVKILRRKERANFITNAVEIASFKARNIVKRVESHDCIE